MGVTLLVPVKALKEGKSRLSGCLNPPQRERLCRMMLRNTLRMSSKLGRTIVVSDDPSVAEAVAKFRDASVTFQLTDVPRDLNRALHEGRLHAVKNDSVLVLPIDLVSLRPETLRAACVRSDTVTIAPERIFQGTNLLHLPPLVARSFVFMFGPGSFSRHKDEARRLGLNPEVLNAADAALDIDTPADWRLVSTASELRQALLGVH